MPTRHPRINLVIEQPLYDAVKKVARYNCLSLSSQARDLILHALEDIEDAGLTKIALKRLRTFDCDKALSHRDVWKSVRREKK